MIINICFYYLFKNIHQQISGSAPETSLLPSPQASGGLLEQKQEQERKDAKQKNTPNNPKEPLTLTSPTFSQAQVKPCTAITGNAVPF
jgi:hypothetical protein